VQQGTEPAGSGRSGEATDEVVDVNLVVLKGRLAADAEHRTYESGAKALRLLVTIRLSEPRQRIDVIPVTMWDPSRDLVRKPPVRGDHVWLTGNVQRRFWEAPEGRRSRVEVIAHEIKRVEPDAVTPTG
jgi:single-strand DNA-binding protein